MNRKQDTQYNASSVSMHPDCTPEESHSYRMQGYHPHQSFPETKKKPRYKPMVVVLFIVLSVIFVYASTQLVLYFVHSRQARQEEQMVQTMIAQSEGITEEPPPAPTPEPSAVLQAVAAPEPTVSYRAPAQGSKPEALIQFSKALAINPDTIGQLQMGESIKAYVVQRDNIYYLRHSFTDEYSFSGAIFLDVTCSIYPQSRNMILHGHNMQDGTAFGKLSRFDDLNYLNRYPFIEFSTLYENARYIPFAAVYYSIDPKSDRFLDLYRINTMSTEEFLTFVAKLQKMSEYLVPVYVAGTDQILTVTTCATRDDNVRFAVFAVKRNGI